MASPAIKKIQSKPLLREQHLHDMKKRKRSQQQDPIKQQPNAIVSQCFGDHIASTTGNKRCTPIEKNAVTEKWIDSLIAKEYSLDTIHKSVDLKERRLAKKQRRQHRQQQQQQQQQQQKHHNSADSSILNGSKQVVSNSSISLPTHHRTTFSSTPRQQSKKEKVNKYRLQQLAFKIEQQVTQLLVRINPAPSAELVIQQRKQLWYLLRKSKSAAPPSSFVRNNMKRIKMEVHDGANAAIQPRPRDYGGLGMARPSILIQFHDPAFTAKWIESYQEHVPGFFGKHRTAVMKKQRNENMLWRQLQQHKLQCTPMQQLNMVSSTNNKKKKTKTSSATLRIGKWDKLSPDERVEAMIKAGVI